MNAHCRCCAVFLAIALGLTGCATTPVNAPSPLASAVTEAYAALNCAPISLAAYNAAVRKICVALATSGPGESFSHLKDLGVSLVLPKIPLRLRSIEISAPLRGVVERSAGIPVVLEYDTKAAPLFPPEGLLSMEAFFTSAVQVGRKSRSGPSRATSFSMARGFNLRAIRLALAINSKNARNGSRSPGSSA